jgi:hypothetical protein
VTSKPLTADRLVEQLRLVNERQTQTIDRLSESLRRAHLREAELKRRLDRLESKA